MQLIFWISTGFIFYSAVLYYFILKLVIKELKKEFSTFQYNRDLPLRYLVVVRYTSLRVHLCLHFGPEFAHL